MTAIILAAVAALVGMSYAAKVLARALYPTFEVRNGKKQGAKRLQIGLVALAIGTALTTLAMLWSPDLSGPTAFLCWDAVIAGVFMLMVNGHLPKSPEDQIVDTCRSFVRDYIAVSGNGYRRWLDWKKTYQEYVDPEARWSPSPEWRRDHILSVAVAFFSKHPDLDTPEYRKWWDDMAKFYYDDAVEWRGINRRRAAERKKAHAEKLARRR